MNSKPLTPVVGTGDLTHVTARGLTFKLGFAADSPVLSDFYRDYDRAFVLPNEKEELAGFATCLALNSGESYAALRTTYGAFREVVEVAYDGEGHAVGGANFILYPVARDQLSLNLNYIFVNPEQRGKGYFGALLQGVTETALAVFGLSRTGPPPLVFIEQNDPLRMSAEDYAADTGHTGLDQLDRIAIWAKRGALIVDFPYVQPALSDDQAADPNLVYSVLGSSQDALSACVLQQHLQRFFAISVLKGRPLAESSEAVQQTADLSERCQRNEVIALLDPLPALKSLKAAPSAHASLRDLARDLAYDSAGKRRALTHES